MLLILFRPFNLSIAQKGLFKGLAQKGLSKGLARHSCGFAIYFDVATI